MKETLKKIGWALVAMLVVVVVIILAQKAMGVEQPMIFKYGISYMSSENMGDAVPSGSIMVLHKQSRYDKGDIISYQVDIEDNGYKTISVTNRITSVEKDKYWVAGDDSEFFYGYVEPGNVHGKVVFAFPGWILITLVVFAWALVGVNYITNKKNAKTESPDGEEAVKDDRLDLTALADKVRALFTKKPVEETVTKNVSVPKVEEKPKLVLPKAEEKSELVMPEAYKGDVPELKKKDDISEDDISKLIASIEQRFANLNK